MTDDPATWVVAGLEMVAVLLILAYWATWFREPHDQAWLPIGYVEHEAAFLFSDGALAVVLLAAAILQVTEQPAGETLGLVAAGMLAFLGILDLAYFSRNGMFRRERGGMVNAAVVVGVLALSVILIARFA